MPPSEGFTLNKYIATPLSLSEMLLVTWVQGWGFLGTWFVFVPLGLHALWRILCLLGLGSFHLVPFSPPWLGALFYWWLASFHELDQCKKAHDLLTYQPTKWLRQQVSSWMDEHPCWSDKTGWQELKGMRVCMCTTWAHICALQHTHTSETHIHLQRLLYKWLLESQEEQQ